jgi:hypothetical protein
MNSPCLQIEQITGVSFNGTGTVRGLTVQKQLSFSIGLVRQLKSPEQQAHRQRQSHNDRFARPASRVL